VSRDAHYPSPLPRILRIALIGAAAGAGYGYFAALNVGGQEWVGIARGTLTGAIIALVLASLLPGPLGAPLRRAPFLTHLGAVSAIYLMAILFALWTGQVLLPQSDGSAAAISRADILFSGAASVLIVFVLEVNRLLGQNVLLNTARIQDACRTTGERVLISTKLVSHLDLSRELTLRSLRPLYLRGKSSEIELFALAAQEHSAI
jgi:hypothetical protein